MRKYFTFIFLAIFHISFSQYVPVQFNHLTVRDGDGLSQKWIKSICRDKMGYLWIGTADGLNKYDGITIKNYKFSISDHNSLNHNNITAIFEDSKGVLWIGTQTGLNKYCRAKDNFLRVLSIPNYISSICEFHNGRFLVGSSRGLFEFNPENDEAVQIINYLSIESIIRVGSNSFWLGTRKGLYSVDTTTYQFKKITISNYGDPIIRSMFKDRQSRIWIGTETHGLFSVMIKKEAQDQLLIKNYTYDIQNPESISKGTIYAITADQDNNLWVGVENGGVNILTEDNYNVEKSKFSHIVHHSYNLSSITNNSIHSLYFDKQNTMWVGSYNGLNYTNTLFHRFVHYNQLPHSSVGINNNNVNAIYDDRKYLFIGTEKGLNIYDKLKETFQYYTHDEKVQNSLSSNVVWSVFRDSRGNLWVGTWGGGLCLFNEENKSFTRYISNEKDTNSIGGNNVSRIIEDKKGNLWIACMGGGLNCFNYTTKRFKQYKVTLNQNSLSCLWVSDIAEDNEGNIWIASTEAVDVFDRKRNCFVKYTNNVNDKKSISYNGATNIFKDSSGNMWIGTSNGLNLFNEVDSTFKCFTEDDGLCNNNIVSIIEDDNQNLWISTSNGISKFINGVNIPGKPIFKNFYMSDGLQGNEFNTRASYKSNDNQLYFGGSNGYNVLNPDKKIDNIGISNIVFTKLLIANKPVKIGDENNILTNDINLTSEIKLAQQHSVFSIEFAALNLIAPEKNEYAYKLEGFDSEWNYVGTQHSATYTNLDPGSYIFKVKTSNGEGLWNEKKESIKIIVIPAWWQSRIAQMFYLVIIILVIYFFRKHTIISVNLKNTLWKEHLEKEKMRELNQLKYQFFINVSHELRTPLTLIIGPLKKLIAEKSNSEIFESIYRNANHLKRLVDQIMDLGKIEKHMMELTFERKDVVESILSVLHNFRDYAGQKGVSLVFKSKLEKCFADLDEDKLDKILTNIVFNALKNTSEKGFITLELDYNTKNKSFELSITDTGKGIPANEIDHIFDKFYTGSNANSDNSGTGIGLNLTHKLIELYKGSVSVSSMVGKGTTFYVTLPLTVYDLKKNKVEKTQTITKINNNVPLVNSGAIHFKFEKTVLIIDDNIEMCNFIESILMCKFNLVKECNSHRAINQIIKHLPDLIICDVMMSGINGFSLCKKIKTDLRFSHIPVVLLTAKANTKDHITGLKIGADDYVYKPFEVELLLARVKNLIDQKENLKRFFIGCDGIINPKVRASDLDIAFVDEVLEHIRKHYSNPEFNVNTVINKMKMSRSFFYRKFKALSDQSVNDLIKNFRLKKASELLMEGNLTVSQVAYDCGFSDPAYFSKVFKEYYKISPKNYTTAEKEIK